MLAEPLAVAPTLSLLPPHSLPVCPTCLPVTLHLHRSRLPNHFLPNISQRHDQRPQAQHLQKCSHVSSHKETVLFFPKGLKFRQNFVGSGR